jgi:hypothetical protein
MTDTLVVPYTSSLPVIPPRSSWARQITEAWQKQIPGIFEVGDLLVRAQAELRHGEWTAMVKNDLPFNRQTAFKLQKIANDARLRHVSHGKHLPAHWATLYELTTLTPAQFNAGISSSAINARMQRKDVKELRGDQPVTSRRERRPSLREQLAEARQEIERLTRSGGDLFNASDSARDIAAVLVRTNIGPDKAERVITEWRRLLRERARQGQEELA